MKKFLMFIIITGAILLTGMTVIKHHVSASLNTVKTAVTKTVASKTIDTADLTTKLNAITAQYPDLDVGVSVIDLNNNQKYTYGETAAYVGASTTKVLTAIVYLHEVEQGKFTLSTMVGDDTAANQITAMIEQSDNDAWAALNDKVGVSFLQAYADGLGMHYDDSNNSLATTDMALLLQKFYSGSLLNAADTNLLLGHMQKSVRNYIGDALGTNYTVYHKAGWLDDRLMDTAIVTGQGKKYILVIFSKSQSGSYDFDMGGNMFTSITNTINDAV